MAFTFEKTFLDGVLIVNTQTFKDDRGYFIEAYKYSDFALNGIPKVFIQDNQSKSSKGVIRGIHFQEVPNFQGKLVRCLKGEIWDVAVDLRPESRTFKQWYGIKLSGDNQTMLYIPEGYGHGFSVLSEDAEILYKCTQEYCPQSDAGVRWDDAWLDIDWKVKNPVISDKDKNLPTLSDYLFNKGY